MSFPSTQTRERLLRETTFVFLLITLVGLTFSIAVSSIAFGAAVILGVTLVILTKKLPATSLDYFFLAYAVAEILSTLFSVDPSSSLFNMKRLLLIALVYLTLVGLDTKQKFTWTLLLVVGVTALLSAIESLMLIGIGDFSARLSTFQHYMTAGGIKMFVALLVLPFLLEKQLQKNWRISVLLSLLPILLALLLTQTRSSWLGFLAGSIVIGVVKDKRFLLALLVVVVLMFLIAPADFTSRATSIFDPTHHSNATRIQMIATGWHMFLDYPVFGTGDIDLRELYVAYTEPIDPAEGGHLHNNFMMLLVTLGIVGFGATMAMFVKIFRVEWKTVQETKHDPIFGSAALGSFAAYLGFHINGLFEWNFGDHEIAVLLWFTVGLALVSRKVSTPPEQVPA